MSDHYVDRGTDNNRDTDHAISVYAHLDFDAVAAARIQVTHGDDGKRYTIADVGCLAITCSVTRGGDDLAGLLRALAERVEVAQAEAKRRYPGPS